MSGYRILTFNWHEGYLCLLAATGHRFDVVQRTKADLWFWLYGTRDVPENVALVHPDDARARLFAKGYDLAICHSLVDCQELASFDVPQALVFHNYRETEIALARAQGDRHVAEFPREVARLAGAATPVFISEGKKASWGLEGPVIPPGIDLDRFHGYEGRDLRVLRVGNFLVERDIMLGGRLQEKALRGLPHSTLGINPRLRDARLSSSFGALLEAYRSHRAFLHTTRAPFEDGHNLALLEAMATGMPVVAFTHPRSPIVNGTSGFVAGTPEAIRQRLFELLENHELARKLGSRARETAAELFPMARFLERWQEVFETLARGAGGGKRERETQRRRVLYLYTRATATETTVFAERALREQHLVVSAGLFEAPFEGLRSPDVVAGTSARAREIWRALPPGFEPDVVLVCVDDLRDLPEDLAELDAPSWAVRLGSAPPRREELEAETRVSRTWCPRGEGDLSLLLAALQALEGEPAEASSASRSLDTIA